MKTRVLMFLMAFYCLGKFTVLSNPNSDGQQKKWPYIQGVAVDFVSKSRIIGAKAILEGTNREALTNEKGEFIFDGLTLGTYNIEVTHPAYRPMLLKNITLEKEHGRYIAINLKSGNPDEEPLVADHSPQTIKVLDELAEPIRTVQPIYPATAIKDKIEGTVYLFMAVSNNGEVMGAWVGEGIREDLNLAALEAAKGYKFKPAKANGKPVGTTVTIPIKFKLMPKGSYSLEEKKEKLTMEDVEDALNFLGIGINRFTYNLPFRHRLIFSIAQFVQGKQKEIPRFGNVTVSSSSGKHTLTLLLHKKDRKLTFGIQSGPVRSNVGDISAEGYNVDGSTTLQDVNLEEKTRKPFFVYVASKQGGIRIDNKTTVEQFVANYDFVIVLYVELEHL